MFHYIIGVLQEVGSDYAVLDNGGIGYMMTISKNTAMALPEIKSDIKLYVHAKIKDEGIVFYGFINHTEKELYLALTSVSGVGPKAAMAILSSNTQDQIIEAIRSNDAKILSMAPGIGLKTAQRIIIDLKDKFGDFKDFEFESIPANIFTQEKSICIDALISLGYSKSKANAMVERTFTEEETTQNNILAALACADTII
jgi:Holliday junction DNA helicase RuvA